MHGMLGTTRKGRKRKSGRRTASGALGRPAENFQAMAANNPDRRSLPAALRLSEKAGSVIGCLNLHNVISNEMYEAGRRYSAIVGAFLAMANAPRGLGGKGLGYGCTAAADCPQDTCICFARTKKYNDAYEVVSRAGTPAQGRAAHMAIKRAAIFDQAISDHQVEPLRLGLRALARHLGLTNHRR